MDRSSISSSSGDRRCSPHRSDEYRLCSAELLLKRFSSPSVTASESTGGRAEQSADEQITDYGLPADPDPEADIEFWRQNSEDLQLIIADLLRTKSAAARLRKHSKLPGLR